MLNIYHWFAVNNIYLISIKCKSMKFFLINTNYYKEIEQNTPESNSILDNKSTIDTSGS